MERIPVKSSNIISVGYDPSAKTLEIEFNSGVYQYFQVPQSVADELLAAPSVGKYFHANIKNAGFLTSKVGSTR